MIPEIREIQVKWCAEMIRRWFLELLIVIKQLPVNFDKAAESCDETKFISEKKQKLNL